MISTEEDCGTLNRPKEPSHEEFQKRTKIIETKLRKSNEEEKWFFQRYELNYGKIVLQIVITLTSFYSLYNYPFLQHYKTTTWGELSLYNLIFF